MEFARDRGGQEINSPRAGFPTTGRGQLTFRFRILFNAAAFLAFHITRNPLERISSHSYARQVRRNLLRSVPLQVDF